MSKTMIEALVKAQMLALTSKDSKERLKYTVAGVKDGKFYDAVGTEYGRYDGVDVEFITEDDLNSQRITGVRLEKIRQRTEAYFGTTESEDEVITESEDEVITESEDDKSYIDVEGLTDACKQAIKDGKFKKAEKIINKLDGYKVAKKLAKKLRKASE